MIKLIQIFCLSLFLSTCSKAKQTDKSKKGDPNFATIEQQTKEPSQEQEYFSNIEDFKKFIIDKKWVDIKGDDPCDPHGQHITVKDGYIYEYNTIEPSEYKIDKILQIDSKTLGIKIQSNSGRNVVFKVEVLDVKKRLVKWIYNYETVYEAKPYDIVCDSSGDYIEDTLMSNESSFPKKWGGFYKFSDAKGDEDWREIKHYDLYVSLDSVNLKSYGYQHVRNRKSYAIQKEDSLFIYGQDQDEDEGLLLKLFVKNNEYVVLSLVDRKGEFKVLKKK
ncbi:hypothetical protein [Aquimarina longa]|uniref:hypothetical protein n=1 Tax=Aquimarina longa TaxID=1080221 RepID=UPI000A87082A|nr:hypothetical protein [Aquimarina longa]